MRKVLICSVSTVAVIAALFVANTNTVADDTKKAEKVDFSKVKCVVNPKAAAKEANVAEYKGGKVYTCCGGCLAKFKKDSSKFATFANHQLVSTKQFKQTKCPISGGKLNKEKTAEIAGVKVAFCCGNCLAKVNKAEKLEDKAKIAFADEAFKKGFAKVETK